MKLLCLVRCLCCPCHLLAVFCSPLCTLAPCFPPKTHVRWLADLRDFCCAPRSVLWTSSGSTILGLHVSVNAPEEPSSTFRDDHHTAMPSSLAAAAPAVAVVFVVARRMLVYHLQPLDSGAVPVLLAPPFVSVSTPSHAHGLPQQLPLECFAVRHSCFPLLGWVTGSHM